MSRKPRNLDDLVGEARKHLVPDTHGANHDWSALDRAIDEQIRTAPPAAISRSGHTWALASGLALAAAAAATLFFRPAPPPVRASASREMAASVEPAPGPGTSATFRIVAPGGDVRAASSLIRLGDRLETGNEPVNFVSRNESGGQAVAWRVEGQSQLVVARARAPLGLALQSGAVEADVARVAQGEAFVVDVGSVRVAVKGTHLRVARTGDRIAVDLSEGTIAIGAIPAAGLTTGQLVRAPAHVEFDLARPADLRVVNEASAVRARGFDHDVLKAAAPRSEPTSPALSTVATSALAPNVVPRPTTTAPIKPAAATLPDPRTPQEIVRDAVIGCIDKTLPAGPVRVVINSTLTLDVEPTGDVKRARFEPPLAPEVQTCASESIYKTRFPGATTERISIAAER